MPRRFAQIDVFSERPLLGNPVAVVRDAIGLTDDQMAGFARWTNLSETTFLLPPTRPDADYLLRIFTPAGELPFAGHPTLGSARAWLMGEAADDGAPEREIVQECGVGLVPVRVRGERLAFAAPPLTRSGPLEAEELGVIERALGIEGHVRGHQWVANGPEWVAVMVDSAERLLALRPDMAALGEAKVGVIAPLPDGPADFEVRAFVPGLGIGEDPVTGSLNAGLALWLTEAGLAPESYTVRQGTALGRDGRVRIERGKDGRVWVEGQTAIVIDGSVALGEASSGG